MTDSRLLDTRWHTYWSGMRDPQHAQGTEAHYRAYAAELRLLLDGVSITRMLEIGCGNGALYPHLGFDGAWRYLGVDFSESMLSEFRLRFPTVDVVNANGATFQSEERFDLVFSSQVAQFWSRAALRRHIDNAVAMLSADGVLVVSGIPWSRARLGYARGDFAGHRPKSVPATVLRYVHGFLRPSLGTWYDYAVIRRMADAQDLQAAFYGSVHYPYRFHAVLRRRAPLNAG